MSFFLSFRFSLYFGKFDLAASVKILVMKITFRVVFANLVERIHVKLSGEEIYLSDEGGVVVVAKVARKHRLGKILFAKNNESDAVGRPFDGMVVLIILSKRGLTLSSSYVFLRKEETVLLLRSRLAVTCSLILVIFSLIIFYSVWKIYRTDWAGSKNQVSKRSIISLMPSARR